jgi:putative hydroxymethylpyrimidine transport system substrate-binding protein
MMPPHPRTLAAVAAALLCAAGLTACGAKKEVLTTKAPLQRVDLLLDYLPNADHAPIYAAQAIGAFREAGLDVRIHTPSDPAAPLKLVQAGKADIAISYEPEVLLARDKGARIAAVGALVQRPLTSLISLKRTFKTVADLRGKTIGTAGIPYQSAYLKTILAQAGVPASTVKEVSVGFDLVPAMLSGKVDATLGAFFNVEGVQLQRKGKHPRIVRVDQAGVPTYQELVFVANFDTLRHRGTVLRRFMQAVSRGTRALEKDPAVGVDALVEADSTLNRAETTAQVRTTLPAFLPTDTGRPWGFMNSDAWESFGRWMLAQKLITKLPSPVSLTNEYLPGRGI